MSKKNNAKSVSNKETGYGIAVVNNDKVIINDAYLADPNNINSLTTCMERAHNGLKGFLDAMEALNEIRCRKLYLCIQGTDGSPKYRTFEDFIQEEYGYTRSKYCRLNNAFHTRKQLCTAYGDKVDERTASIPLNESTYYELSKIPSDKLDEALTELSQLAGDGHVTSLSIAQWCKEHLGSIRSRRRNEAVISSCENEESNLQDMPADNAPANHDNTNEVITVIPVPSANQPKPTVEQDSSQRQVIMTVGTCEGESDDANTPTMVSLDANDASEELDEEDDADDEDDEDDEDETYNEYIKELRRILYSNDFINYCITSKDDVFEEVCEIINHFTEEVNYSRSSE